MIQLTKLFKTSAFKLSVGYSVIFALIALVVISYASQDMEKALDDQIAGKIDAGQRGLTDVFEQGGLSALVEAIERRTADPGGDVYLLSGFTGQPIVGNLTAMPVDAARSRTLTAITYVKDGVVKREHRALVRVSALTGGFLLLVGQDISERQKLKRLLHNSLIGAVGWLVLFGAVGGLVLSRRVLLRVDAMSDSARTIMGGDLTRRLPSSGSGDELDRLANSINAMIARIETLMNSMREMTDNVAHDLRTPLTRLRNRAESALRRTQPQDGPTVEELTDIISEADGLMRIFDALLLIARAQSGSGPDLERIDAGRVTRDVGELYEAAVEQEGGILVIEVETDLYIQGHRELLAQALANLIENAIKYGKNIQGETNILLSARARKNVVELIVADSGAGVPPEDRRRITERFVRLEKARSKKGAGLGLSLVQAIVQSMSGKLTFSDNEPGLCVVLTFPAGSRSGGSPR